MQECVDNCSLSFVSTGLAAGSCRRAKFPPGFDHNANFILCIWFTSNFAITPLCFFCFFAYLCFYIEKVWVFPLVSDDVTCTQLSGPSPAIVKIKGSTVYRKGCIASLWLVFLERICFNRKRTFKNRALMLKSDIVRDAVDTRHAA